MPAAAPTFNDSTDPCIGIDIDLVDLEIISATYATALAT